MMQPARRKFIDKPIIIALGAVALLAVATIVVVVAHARRSPSNSAASSSGSALNTAIESGTASSDSGSTSAQSSGGGDSGTTTTLTSDTAKLSYSYPNDAVSTSNGGGWIGPKSGNSGGYVLDQAMELPTCSKSPGNIDFYAAATTSTSTDPAAAATDVVSKIGLAELSGQSPVMNDSITTTDENLANGTQGVLAEVTFNTSADDPCATTSYHLGAFATCQNKTMGILIVSYSMDGDSVDGTTYQNLAIEILKSIKKV